MAATFTKLRDGSWGIKVEQITKPNVGDIISVSKKDGTTSNVAISKVLWSNSNAYLCAIESQEKTYKTKSSNSSNSNLRNLYRRRYGWDGVVGSPSYYSSGLYDEES